MKNHLKTKNLLLVWTRTAVGLLLLATSVQAVLVPTTASTREETTTTGGTLVEEEKADGHFFGNKKQPTSAPTELPTSSPTREPGRWVAATFIGQDCNDACSNNSDPPGFTVCNAVTAHPLVNTEAKFRYVIEVELGFVGLTYPYVGGASPLNPGARGTGTVPEADLTFNTDPATPTTCEASDPDFQRVCCCGPTTGLVCRVEP